MNVLSKIDLIKKYGDVDYDLDYYTELPAMTRMLFGVDRQHQGDRNEKEEEMDEFAGECCDEEDFVNRARDPFQKKYRR